MSSLALAGGARSSKKTERPNPPPRDWRDPYWQQQADLVRSGELSPETVRMATAFQLNWLGRTGYRNLYPEVFKNFPSMKPRIPSADVQRLQDLQFLYDQYSGPEGAVIRHLLKNEIEELKYVTSSLYHVPIKPPEYKPPPIPEWMKPYVETRTVTEEAKMPWAQPKTKTVGVLRPLGAQTELTPEQMGYMAGYQAWLEAGSPRKVTPEILSRLSDWQRYWDYYKRQSEELFPKQQSLTPRWAIARQ